MNTNKNDRLNLQIHVVEIQGHCPIYRIGNSFHIEDKCKLIADHPVCMHAL